jgi:hypothetical protein
VLRLLTPAVLLCCWYCCAALVLLLQANAGQPDDPDSKRSSWFSNPGASNTAATQRAGVGKYIQQAALEAPLGSSKPAGSAAAAPPAAAAATAPAAKKQKVAQPMLNFDAW